MFKERHPLRNQEKGSRLTKFCSQRPWNCWNFCDISNCALPTALRTFPKTVRDKKKKEIKRPIRKETINCSNEVQHFWSKPWSHQKRNFRDPQGTNCSHELHLQLHLSATAPSGRPNTDLAEDMTTSKLAGSSSNCPQPLREPPAPPQQSLLAPAYRSQAALPALPRGKVTKVTQGPLSSLPVPAGIDTQARAFNTQEFMLLLMVFPSSLWAWTCSPAHQRKYSLGFSLPEAGSEPPVPASCITNREH